MEVNFTTHNSEALTYDETLLLLQDCKQHNGRKTMQNLALFDLPKRLWNALLDSAGIAPAQRGQSSTNRNCDTLPKSLPNAVFL